MAKSKMLWIYIVLGLVAVYFLVPSFSGWVNGLFGTKGGAGEEESPWEGKCLEHDAITMTLGPIEKRYDKGNAAEPKTTSQTIYHRVFIDGIDRGLKEDGTTMTVSAGQKVCIYYAENTTWFYAAKSCFDVPCEGAFSSASYGDVKAYQLVGMKNLTLAVFNADDSLKNTQANNETLVLDDEADMDFVITFPGIGGVSPYGRLYVNVFVNKTVFKEVTMDGEDVIVASPSAYRSKTNSTAGFTFYTFSVPGREGYSSTKRSYTMGFKTESSGLALDTAIGANATINTDDEDWYQNTDTGEMAIGPNDNDRADVGIPNDSSYVVYFRSAA